MCYEMKYEVRFDNEKERWVRYRYFFDALEQAQRYSNKHSRISMIYRQERNGFELVRVVYPQGKEKKQ